MSLVAFKVYDVDRDGFISNGELFLVLKMMVGNNLKVSSSPTSSRFLASFQLILNFGSSGSTTATDRGQDNNGGRSGW